MFEHYTIFYSLHQVKVTPFKKAISDCLAQIHTLYKEDLDSLLTLNFQSFKDVKKVQVVTL